MHCRSALTLIVVGILCAPQLALADCSDAESSADDAYSYARRAYNEDDFDTAQFLIRMARNAAEDTISYAQECGCDDAESAADDASSYADQADNASDLDELHDYARQVMGSAEEASDAASSCS